jgi:hypothetical protein
MFKVCSKEKHTQKPKSGRQVLRWKIYVSVVIKNMKLKISIELCVIIVEK